MLIRYRIVRDNFGDRIIRIATADFSQEKSTGRTAPPVGSPVLLR